MSEPQLLLMPEIRRIKTTGKLVKNFELFHNENPKIYSIAEEIAVGLKGMGFERSSMKFIFERMRWRYAIQTRGDSYKLNNNYTAFYARVLMRVNPILNGFFSLRNQRSSMDADAVVIDRIASKILADRGVS